MQVGVFVFRAKNLAADTAALLRNACRFAPQSFFSVSSTSITAPSLRTGGVRPPMNLDRDDNSRSNMARLIQGKARRKTVAKPVTSAGPCSPRDRKLTRQSASRLTMIGRRAGFGNRPTVRNFPFAKFWESCEKGAEQQSCHDPANAQEISQAPDDEETGVGHRTGQRGQRHYDDCDRQPWHTPRRYDQVT
jgi:hypothetical protein